ncbi:hypothetical protein ACFL51_02270 [Myxococcota bacterium]
MRMRKPILWLVSQVSSMGPLALTSPTNACGWAGGTEDYCSGPKVGTPSWGFRSMIKLW